MEASVNGYVTSGGGSYEEYYSKIMSMTPQESFIASFELGFNMGVQYNKDWRQIYESRDNNEFKGKWRMKMYETCKEIYSGSLYEFKDFENEYFYRLNKDTAKKMKDAGGPSLGLIHSEDHVGGILLTQAGNVVEFNTETSPRVQQIVKILSNGTVTTIFDIQDLQTNKHSDNVGCQTLVFMFAAPFLAGAENATEKLRAMERAMNYNEYMLDGLALFAKAVVGVRYHKPPVPGYDRRVLSDVVTKAYPQLLRSQLS